MNKVDEMIQDVLKREGGFTDDENDNGHKLRVDNGDNWDSFCTNYGVTQFTLSDFYGRQATVEEVKNLDVDTAKQIYKTGYYYSPRIDWLAPIIQPSMFDMSINHGPFNTIKMLQGLLQQCNQDCVQDGIIGPATKAMTAIVAKEMGRHMVNALIEERLNYYRAIIRNDPTQKRFWNNWSGRAESFRISEG